MAARPIVTVGTELTRPADANPYAAKDVIASDPTTPAQLLFPDMFHVAFQGSFYIVKARIQTTQKTCTAKLRLHLFSAAPTAVGDNVPYPMLYANRAIRLTPIDFPALATEDATASDSAEAFDKTIRHVVVGGNNATSIWGILETLDIFTPASAQKFYIELTADRAN